MAQFAVIGLGRFGSAASIELTKMGHSVLGVDNDSKVINRYADEISRAVIADVTEKAALEELGLDNYDNVLVAIGDDIQASLVCVVHLKSLGITSIWVKAISHAQHLILSKLGVQRIIHPEEEMGIRVSQMLSYPMVNDYISLGNGDFVVEITASDRLEDATIGEVVHSKNGAVKVLLIKRRTQSFVHPEDNFALQPKDIVILFGPLQALRTIAPKLI
ncbi:TrkA family potassium uptake protein [Paenalcaligenes niemegkensis]|uniref:potassium channel family protein n=1 Tax=Paenalcaligenes niemegkensis TaxID=2895469 RepID=UPI001EE90704|nr:TrkA family potassium uptake protein [Paenalcaligenes niemegkensis]MCQ9616366.1 TrkA family potassium uptake protein [Paenalcaligenes niemegkensis]